MFAFLWGENKNYEMIMKMEEEQKRFTYYNKIEYLDLYIG